MEVVFGAEFRLEKEWSYIPNKGFPNKEKVSHVIWGVWKRPGLLRKDNATAPILSSNKTNKIKNMIIVRLEGPEGTTGAATSPHELQAAV